MRWEQIGAPDCAASVATTPPEQPLQTMGLPALDMMWTYNMSMKIANVAEFKNHLSEYLAAVANGEQVEVRKRNTPLARVVPIQQPGRNRTVLGCGEGSVVVKADLAAPMIPDTDWEMLGDEPS